MRMWMIDPRHMCDRHLLGEHGEIHKHRHIFEKKYSIRGRVEPIVQIEPKAMKIRHDELVREMEIRGIKHVSPYSLPDLRYLSRELVNVKVDRVRSYIEIKRKCDECRRR